MPLIVLPDAERIVHDWLAAYTEVAAIVGTRVVSELPASPTYPILRLFRLGGIPPIAYRLDEANIQLEAWADTKSAATNLARVARAALVDLRSHVTAYGVVSDVRDTLGLQWLPDPVTNKPRVVWSQSLRVRPL